MGCDLEGRHRLQLTLAALLPAALALPTPLTEAAGRLCWLAPMLALPAGLLLRRLWAPLGMPTLARGLVTAFGDKAGKVTCALYLLWGLFLTEVAARRYAARLALSFGGGFSPWLFLSVGLALSLWLGRGDGRVLGRAAPLLFGGSAFALLLSLALAAPAANWQNLLPPEKGDWSGLLPAFGLVLSLSGWGIFALCLPGGKEEPAPGLWVVGACAVLTALLYVIVGAFGPALTLRMADPYLYLLETARLPGGLRRGEAALVAVLALADFALLALLVRGCGSLWEALAPRWRGRGLWLPLSAAFLLAGGPQREQMTAILLFWGGLTFGGVLPALAACAKKGRRRGSCRTTSCEER